MRISKLEPSQRVKGRWLVWLDDGRLLRVSENEVVFFSLYAGKELSDAACAELAAAAGASAVREKALGMISVRPMSRRELTQKLTARPGTREKLPVATLEQAEETADWLEHLGYLDDAEYAKTVVRHYSAKGYGARKLRDELFHRGVPREFWDAALEEARPPEDGIDVFLRSRLKGGMPDKRELKRVSDALARRGYRWEEIREGLRRYGAELEEE